MHDTAFHVPADKLDRMTVNYSMQGRRFTPVDGSKSSQFATPPEFLSGGGGVVSTADDYLRFCQMMLNRGELEGARILRPETVDLMTRNHLADELVPISLGQLSVPNTGFGLDFAVRVKVDKGEPAGSLGEYWWGGAASTQFFVAPGEKLICVSMTQMMSMNATYLQQVRPMLYGAILEPAAAK
jgi:CubicO group peptidase (beta-lactamase class C family)